MARNFCSALRLSRRSAAASASARHCRAVRRGLANGRCLSGAARGCLHQRPLVQCVLDSVKQCSAIPERIAAKLLTGKVRMLDALANHQIGQPKLYLRKAQSNRGEYIKLAEEHGLAGEFDVREWVAIEGKDYLPMGTII